MLANGADGGILASAHVRAELFVEAHARMARNDHQGALEVWRQIEPTIPLLFKEANPMPLKHLLWRQGLIASPECRLPLLKVSDALAKELDQALLTAAGA
jgi:4-hydroxy-tetrahydrodipicolinate synthase